MSDINEKIKAYLKKDEPEYFEGVELYEQHPGVKMNLAVNMRQRYNVGSMHEKLIYELEKLVGVEKYSNRKAVYKHGPGNIPFRVIEKTQEEAPKDYEYKVAYKDLPEEMKKLVVEKGQLYNELDQAKKNLGGLGTSNDEHTVIKRQAVYKEMRQMSDRIKNIHAILMGFDKNKKFDQGEIDNLENQAIGLSDTEPENLSQDELLQEEFKYQEMGYYERKDLLNLLRSSVPRQEQRAKESNKENIRKKNQEKAELGRRMIEVLEEYFKLNVEPK